MTVRDEQNDPAAPVDTATAGAEGDPVDEHPAALAHERDQTAPAEPADDPAADPGESDDSGATSETDELDDADDVDEQGEAAEDARAGEDSQADESGENDRPVKDAAAVSGGRRRRRTAPPARPRPTRAAVPALSLNVAMPAVDVRAWFTTARDGVRTLMARPLTSFHLVVSLALVLTVFGLIMVQSASSVEGYAQHQSAYGAFVTQTIFAIAGWIAFYLVLRLPIRFFRRIATTFVWGSIVLLALVLVPNLGVEVDGARRWFDVGGISIQPSELAKLALCIWGAHVLASRRRINPWGWGLLVPLVPVSALMSVLIILEPNLSTTVIIAIITGALLWFSGLPVKVFGAFVAAITAAAMIAALSADYRAARVFSFLGTTDDPLDGGYQALQAKYALANGGVFGVGLGQSTAKWSYLPNAHNDFIFAILVEETGLVGGLAVVGLFLLLGYVGMRIALRSADPFLRLLTGTITVLICTQMFINVGYVVGLLPVTGIQLPLLSQGGTSMLTMLTMLGLLASAARHEPEAVAALATRRHSRFSGALQLPPPTAYRPKYSGEPLDRLGRRRAAGRMPDPSPHRTKPSRPGSARPGAARIPAGRTQAPRTPSAGRSWAPGSGGARTAMPRASTARRPAPRDRGYPPSSAAAPRRPFGARTPAPPPREASGRPLRTRAQVSDEIHYPARQASTRFPSDPRRSAGRDRTVSSPRGTEYRQR